MGFLKFFGHAEPIPHCQENPILSVGLGIGGYGYFLELHIKQFGFQDLSVPPCAYIRYNSTRSSSFVKGKFA